MRSPHLPDTATSNHIHHQRRPHGYSLWFTSIQCPSHLVPFRLIHSAHRLIYCSQISARHIGTGVQYWVRARCAHPKTAPR